MSSDSKTFFVKDPSVFATSVENGWMDRCPESLAERLPDVGSAQSEAEQEELCFDIKLGQNLLMESEQDKVLQSLEKNKPLLTTISPPCTSDSTGKFLNYDLVQSGLKQQQARAAMITLTTKPCMTQKLVDAIVQRAEAQDDFELACIVHMGWEYLGRMQSEISPLIRGSHEYCISLPADWHSSVTITSKCELVGNFVVGNYEA